MTRTLTLAFDREGEHETTLGQFVYRLRDAAEDSIPVSILSAAVTIPGSGETVTLESAVVEHTGNTSFAIFFAGEQILLAGCQWGRLAPHISVRLPIVGAWLQVYCQAS